MIINKSPFEYLNNIILNINYIRVLGSLAYIYNNKRDSKLDVKFKRGILVGFESFNNYLVFKPKDNKVYNIRDVRIIEN